VFAGEIKKLQADKLKPQEQLTLEPYERDHAVVVGTYRYGRLYVALVTYTHGNVLQNPIRQINLYMYLQINKEGDGSCVGLWLVLTSSCYHNWYRAPTFGNGRRWLE
jgi:hypothetical protein